ncbi:hypothetical protein LJR030_001653 [Rhizobium sp. LjRoot30]|uniref:hypothetical protein n=1 Tax=Rhizobium sp. LjRoot30 TaxID=3342320 RepID=UPI003ED02279
MTMFAKMAVAAVLLAAPALADDQPDYVNSRFGFGIDLPPDFIVIHESNGDGMRLASPDRKTLLSVFGTNLLDKSLEDEVRERIDMQEKNGWQISYKKISPGSASFSGSRDGRILYVRAVALCDGAAGFAWLEYDKAALKKHDPLVRQLVKTLHPAEGCAAGNLAPPPSQQ